MPEAEALRVVNRFGIEALGQITPGFIRRLMFLERASAIWQSRAESNDWVVWAEQHKAENDFLLSLTKVSNAIRPKSD